MHHAKKLLVAASLLGLAGVAQADLYVGAGLYSSALDAGVAGDDKDIAPSVFVGWRPIELVGVEAGYIDLGSFNIGGTDVSAHAMTVAGLLSMELGPVGVYLKGGMADSTVKAGGSSGSSTDPFGGVGLSFDAMDKLYVYGEYLRMTSDDANVDFDVFGAGVRYAF